MHHSHHTLWLGDLPPVALVLHGLGDLDETGNVATSDQARELALSDLDVLLGGVETLQEAVLHDALESLINLLGGPGETLAILGHLETGDSDTTAVGSLTRSIPDSLALVLLAVGLEDVDGLLGAAHVGTLGDESAAGGNKTLGLLLADLVLGGRWKSNVDLADMEPGAGTLNPLESALVVVGGKGLALDLEVGDGLDILGGDEVVTLSDQGALGVGKGKNSSTKLNALEGSVLGDVAGTRDDNALALPVTSTVVLEHVADVVDETVASGLGADQGTTPGEALAGKDTLEPVADLAVGAEHEADLAATDTDITSGDVSLGADVLGELAHEGNAEAANLSIALALGVEVGATFAAAHVQAGESILEDLLKAEELETAWTVVSANTRRLI